MEQALSDVKILDLTHFLAGPMCTKYLADLGADVIKIEKPPNGDSARMLGPFYKDERHPEKSGTFLYLNANKRGITLNLKSEAGKKIFLELLEDMDILVENFKPGVMERLGFDYETLEKVNPGLVMTRISNFGQTGPYRDFELSELVLDAMGHIMYSLGLSDRGPLKYAGNCLLYQGGLIGSVATMGAFIASRAQGKGQMIDVSLYELTSGSINSRNMDVLGYFYTGNVSYRPLTAAIGLNLLPAGMWPCKEGFIYLFGPMPAGDGPRLARLLGQPDLFQDPKFSNYFDLTNKGEIDAMLYNWLAQYTHLEAFDQCAKERFPSGAVLTPSEAVEVEQYNQRGFWVEIEHPMTGRVKYPGAPMKMSETPWQIKRHAPLLGQHNEEVYGQLGYGKQELARLQHMGII